MVTALVAIAVTLVSTPLVIHFLATHELVDVPNSRSSHATTVPRGGGISVLAGFAIAILASGALQQSDGWVLLVGGIVYAGLGLADDVSSLPARSRLGLQVVFGTLMAVGLISTSGDKAPGWSAATVMVAEIAAALWIVAYVNAFNFMDGVNGISAMSAIVAGSWFWLVASNDDETLIAAGGLAVAGAALGFLPWNTPTARVFLGDVGSYGLGALVAGLALLTLSTGHNGLLATAPLLPYLADTGSALLRRLRCGEPVFEAHRTHVYQRLVDLGWGHLGSSSTVAMTAAIACAFVWWLPAGWAAVALVPLLGAYLFLPVIASTWRPVTA